MAVGVLLFLTMFQRQTSALVALALLLTPACRAAAAQAPAFPCRDQAVLDAVELRGPWQFRFDPADEGAGSEWFGTITNADTWKPVAVPGVWDTPAGAVTGHVAQTVGWYRLSVPVPRSWNQDVTLAFLGAQYTADVWVNGEYVGVHRGGFTPFLMDVTAHARPGSLLAVAVRVSNIVDRDTVPALHCGWQHYGGLCREVYLLHQPAVRPASIDVATRVEPDGSCVATVRVPFNRVPPRAPRLRARLADGRQVVATAECALSTNAAAPPTLDLAVKRPRLWSPSTPVLHTLTLDWEDGRHSLPIGLRSLRVDGERLLLNGQPLWLQGFGQHEIAPGRGPIVRPDLRRRDLEQMKQAFDANAIRPGHYPNHPDLYNLCDELGLIVFTEIPAWQLPGAAVVSDDAWDLWLEPQLREMATSLRHHPSVCFWGVANEIGGVHAYYRRAVDYLHGLDPSRPVSAVHSSTQDLESVPIFDMEARNFHYGWYHSRDVYDGPLHAAQVFAAARGKPVWVAETGGIAARGALGGGYSEQARGTETYLDRILRFNFQFAATVTNQVAGVSVWSWTDFGRRDTIEAHGVLDVTRQPKLAAYALRSIMHGDLRLFIVERNSFVEAGRTWQAQLRTFNPRLTARKGLVARWTVLKGAARVGGGDFAFDATTDRSQPVTGIEWAPPTNAAPGMYTVWTELMENGRRLHVNSSVFDLQQPSCPGILRLAPTTGADKEPWVALGGVRMPVYPLVGLQVPLEEGSYELTFGDGDRARGTMPCAIRRAEITTPAWPVP